MEWIFVISAILVIFLVVYIFYYIKWQSRDNTHKLDEIVLHLQGLNIQAEKIQPGSYLEKMGANFITTHVLLANKPIGIIKIFDKSVDYVNIIAVQDGYDYYYLVRLSESSRKIKRKFTIMNTVREWEKDNDYRYQVKIVDVIWNGDNYLCDKLNSDHELKRHLIDSMHPQIPIYPKEKYGYALMQIRNTLPTSDLFEALDAIGHHIKNW